MFAKIAILIFVLVTIALLAPLVLSGVKKAKKRYDEMAEEEWDSDLERRHTLDQENCDHIYYPAYSSFDKEVVIGQRCKLCSKFNSLADLGLEEDDVRKREERANSDPDTGSDSDRVRPDRHSPQQGVRTKAGEAPVRGAPIRRD
jgi:hypothetical protein